MSGGWKKFGSLLLFLAILSACQKTGNLLTNQPPDSRFVVDSINLSGDNRLNSRIRLSWFGTDIDGYVAGYELSLDATNWIFTRSQDSLFQFAIPPGEDTTDIELWLRAVDDKGERDPDPAYLRVPLKNTPPSARFDEKSQPNDTVRSVVTFVWNYDDPDGKETVTQAFIKANQGPWTPINQNQALVSFLLDPSATTMGSGDVYYGTQTTSSFTIEGLLADAPNQLYVKVVDLAGAESAVDSSNVFFLKQKKNNLLVVGGQPASVKQIYIGLLQDAGVSFDLEDYNANTAALAPKYWDPTFRLLTSLYDQLFIYADPNTLPANPVTGTEERLLSLAAPAVQAFTDKGGKSLTTTSFTPTADITPLIGAFPIDQLIASPGQARIVPDSGVFAMDTTTYPALVPINIDIGVDPFVKSADAEDFYRGRLTKLNGWSGDNLIASRRLRNGNPLQILFSIELHRYVGDRQAAVNLFDQIFNEDFDW